MRTNLVKKSFSEEERLAKLMKRKLSIHDINKYLNRIIKGIKVNEKNYSLISEASELLYWVNRNNIDEVTTALKELQRVKEDIYNRCLALGIIDLIRLWTIEIEKENAKLILIRRSI